MFTKEQAEIVLYRLRKCKLNAFLIGSIALKGKGIFLKMVLDYFIHQPLRLTFLI